MEYEELKEAYEYVISSIVGRKVKERPGLVSALEELCKGSFIILSAPPGYGKTSITFTHAYLSAKSMGPWAPRVIHVLPLRSIAEEIYGRLFYRYEEPKIRELNKENVAMQMLGHPGSPSLQKTLILTTIDTYLLTSIRLPPGEYIKIRREVSLGHGEYSRSALALSATIFDEIQLFVEESSRTPSALKALLAWLLYLKNPLIIMSATIPEAVEKFITSVAKVFSRETKIFKYGKDFKDEVFENKKLSNEIETDYKKVEDMEAYSKIVNKEIRKNETYDRVLIISNTVKKAIALAKKIREEFGDRTLVLHGKMVSMDRENIIKRIKKLNKWILITTQVIEAGVNVSAQMLITEAAPPTSLIQRIGRLLRLEENEEGKLIILYDMSEEINMKHYTVYPLILVQTSFKYITEKHGRICWQIPYIKKNRFYGYEKFIEEVYLESGFEIKIENDVYTLLKSLLFKTTDPRSSLRALETYGNLVREQPLILGVVDFNEMFKAGKEYEFKNMAGTMIRQSFPLSLNDLKKLIRINALALILENSFLKCVKLKEIFKEKHSLIIRKISSSNLFSIIIPNELYDKFYGFKL